MAVGPTSDRPSAPLTGPSPPSVAVIGAGPGGMFFCHALETHRRDLEEQGDANGLAMLPVVTCFDRSSGPGGVWRAERSFTPSQDPKVTCESSGHTAKATNMYEALWTNGPKEAIEFFDYTYDEHFGGRPLPVYMPRQAILEYMVGRVTKLCPDFLEKYMKFNTRVESVCFVEAKKKFEIVTHNALTGEKATEDFDKCIWAGGMNGHPNIPASMLGMLQDGGFSGRIVHSSDTANFQDDVQGKTILLVGGSYSGEDLALMAVKCGAKKVYISSRSKNVVSWTSAWPYNKVEVLEAQLPVRVTEKGRCIHFASAEYAMSDDDGPEARQCEGEGEDMETEVRDVDTIVFCTGYLPNLDMLSEELRQSACRSEHPEVAVPKGWKMAPNPFTEALGHVEPMEDLTIMGCLYPGLYCGCVSIDNPGMMFMTFESENPLLGIDVTAWMLMRFVTGLRALPAPEEMLKREKDAALQALNNPGYRCLMDKNYIMAIEDNWDQLPDVPESKHEWLDEVEIDYDDTLEVRMLTRYLQEAEYPLEFGSIDGLNDAGIAYAAFDRMTRDHRGRLAEKDANSGNTFRDYSDGSDFASIFTGSVAVSLKTRWLDIDATGLAILEP